MRTTRLFPVSATKTPSAQATMSAGEWHWSEFVPIVLTVKADWQITPDAGPPTRGLEYHSILRER